MENEIIHSLEGCFVLGFGISSEFYIIDFAKGRDIFRLWIDSDFRINLDNEIEGLNEEQMDLVKLNALKNLEVRQVALDNYDNLKVTFEDELILDISSNPSDINSLEPMRFYQIEPEKKTIWICLRVVPNN